MKIRIEVCVPVVTAIKGTLIKHIDCHQKSDFQFKLVVPSAKEHFV